MSYYNKNCSTIWFQFLLGLLFIIIVLFFILLFKYYDYPELFIKKGLDNIYDFNIFIFSVLWSIPINFLFKH